MTGAPILTRKVPRRRHLRRLQEAAAQVVLVVQQATQNQFKPRLTSKNLDKKTEGTYRSRRRRWWWWWWRRRRRRRFFLFRNLWLFRRLDELHIVCYVDHERYSLHHLKHQIGGHTREQSRLCTTLPDPTPPSFIDFFNLFDQLAFYKAHLIVFRSLMRNASINPRLGSQRSR